MTNLTSKSNYRCFFCNYETKEPCSVESSCLCGKTFNYVLENRPSQIGQYKIEQEISRGFYGATFIALKGRRNQKRVLKVIPKKFYAGREEKFDQEIDQHFRAAENSDFIAKIFEDPFEAEVVFGHTSVDCFCIEMEYVGGFVLEEIYKRRVELTPEHAVQLTCDLICILQEFQQKGLQHNDLHASNIVIKELPQTSQRADAVSKGIKAVAIDLGSADSQRREGKDFLSDIQWVAAHMREFAQILLQDNPEDSDLRARLGFYLRNLSLQLETKQSNQSDQNFQDFINQVRETYSNSLQKYHSAWKAPLQLSSLSQHRNAQTLESWHVPHLMVDPDKKWLSELNSGGPVIVTGMRGCGKTMLLRSLEVHARIIASKDKQKSSAEKRQFIDDDGFIGLYASARHLGFNNINSKNQKGERHLGVATFFARLFLVYASRVCDALNHLEEECPNSVKPEAAFSLAAVVFGQIGKAHTINRGSSLDELQTSLLLDAELWASDQFAPSLKSDPWQAFVLLAKTIQSVVEGGEELQIAYLLDDVSTRYLEAEEIEQVVSTLLVQDPVCSFKITSETQTFFLSLKSPARINFASAERDYLAFDLGSKVLEQLKNPKTGSRFLENILQRRMAAHGGELSSLMPKSILGDVSLSEIAKSIAATSNFSGNRSSTYHGFSALRGVCIGDLGTTIALYEKIIGHARIGHLPVPPKDQNKEFQTFCSNQLFQLNSRDQRLKGASFSLKRLALDFAEASHAELIESVANPNDRLRQITSMNVTLDDGAREQTEKLLELVDAGVFALHPRISPLRSKNRAADPVLQFQLSYRKILGISKFIGLSDRDRFELSGEQLLDWLASEDGIRNLRARTRAFTRSEEKVAKDFEVEELAEISLRPEISEEPELPFLAPPESELPKTANKKISAPTVQSISLSKIPRMEAIFVSLGFEDRCLPSAERIVRQTRPERIFAIEYDIPGFEAETKALADRIGAKFEKLQVEDVLGGNFGTKFDSALVDCSGLTKPVIFQLVKHIFQSNTPLWTAISEPKEYNPTEEDLANVMGDGGEFWGDAGVDALSKILSGDHLPYDILSVDGLVSDPSRSKKLCAFSSAKHGRLLHLVEETNYDEIDVFHPKGTSNRHKVGEKTASIATRGGELGRSFPYRSDDPTELMKRLFDNHAESYFHRRSNYELALTGGKLEAIVCGVMASALPINRVVYVKPDRFDAENFSKGIGRTKVYKIS